jgi:hypothetical protein
MKYSKIFLLILTLSISTSCASTYISPDHPAINSSYKTTLTFTALSRSKQSTKNSENIQEDYIMKANWDDFTVNLGQASIKSLASGKTQNSEFKARGPYSFHYGGNDLLTFESIRNGEYKVTSKRICVVNMQGKGQIFGQTYSESGEITIICPDDIYTGNYICKGELINNN